MKKLKLVLSLIFISSILTLGIPLLINGQTFAAAQTLGENWTAPTDISSTGTYSDLAYSDRAIAIDSSGNLHVVYSRISDNEAGNTEIYYATNAGGSWSNTNISKFNDTNYSCRDPVIAIAPNDLVHVAWRAGKFDFNYDIYYTNNSGGTWTTPVNVTDTGSLFEFEPSLTVGADNTLHLVYSQLTGLMGGYASLIYNNYSVAEGWSAPQNLTSGLPVAYGISSKKSIGLDPNGNIYVAFAARFLLYSNINYVFLVNNSEGTWGVSVNISQIVGLNYVTQTNPAMDIDNEGTIHLLFEDANYSISLGNLIYTSYSQGGWTTPQNISATNYYTGGASLITDTDNNVHIAFSQSNSSGWANIDIYYTTNVGGAFINPVNVTRSEGVEEFIPHLILDAQRYVHIVFVFNESDPQIQYVRSLYPAVPADFTAIIIIGVVVAVVVVAGVAVYLLKIREPK
jgi:hypothetical protein